MDAHQLDVWGEGVRSELAFWDKWFRTKGLEWPDDYSARLAEETPIDPFLMDLLDAVDLTKVRILDVGAGPISKLGKMHKGIKLSITACDPLADQYAAIRERYKVTAPIQTVEGFAEDLASFFPSDHFDLVHCSNALDHSFDPLRGIIQMLQVVKPGAVLVLKHAFNEAEHAKYNGLHQWNFDLQNDRFIIWNPKHRIDVAEVLSPFATVTAENLGNVTAIITRTNSISPEFVDPQSRNRELISLLTKAVASRAMSDARAAAADNRATAADNRAAAADKRAAAADKRAAAAEEQHNALLRSTSWRVTAPLRSASRVLSAMAPKGA